VDGPTPAESASGVMPLSESLAGALTLMALELGFYMLAYRVPLNRLGPVVQHLVGKLGVEDRYSVREVESIAALTAAALAQMAFAGGLLLLTGVQASQLIGVSSVQLDVVGLGAALGIGEMALSTFLCNVWMRAALLRPLPEGPASMSDWLVLARGGWMRHYRATLALAPFWLAGVSVVLYVAVEEIVFRGIVISFLRPGAGAWSVALSVLLFISIQGVHMP
jgi:membrane protease YdiL (CAAX protease family)